MESSFPWQTELGSSSFSYRFGWCPASLLESLSLSGYLFAPMSSCFFVAAAAFTEILCTPGTFCLGESGALLWSLLSKGLKASSSLKAACFAQIGCWFQSE